MQEKLDKLENSVSDLTKFFYEIASDLRSINTSIKKVLNIEERVIRQEERQKVNEKRIEKVERSIVTKVSSIEFDRLVVRITDAETWINNINLKIAIVSWGYDVILFILNKFI